MLLKQQKSILGGIKSLRLKKLKTTKEPVQKQKQKRKDIFSSLSSGSFFFCWINALSAARYVEEVKAIFGSEDFQAWKNFEIDADTPLNCTRWNHLIPEAIFLVWSCNMLAFLTVRAKVWPNWQVYGGNFSAFLDQRSEDRLYFILKIFSWRLWKALGEIVKWLLP